jgi:3-isopropylmalate/(R)-2-methylmalate dehydratase small subunit
MKPFTRHTGRAIPLDRSDVDTDQIVPAEHLRRIERSGFGPFLFAEWRRDPDFVLGSGSSREHAVWALEDAGFHVVIAPSFADIFRNNCFKVGLLPVELPQESVRALMDAVLDDPGTEITVDLDALRVSATVVHESFEIDPYTRWRLLEGLDDVDLTLRHAAAIDAYERARPARLPSVPRP